MHIKGIITCVDYDDFLQLTLHSWLEQLDSVTVLTAPTDDATIAVARNAGANVMVTNAWSVGGPFNKARALNEWLDRLTVTGGDTWVLTIDADVLAPSSQVIPSNLDERKLYGVRRRMCEDVGEWHDFRQRKRSFDSFRVDVPEVIDGRLWGVLPTQNEAGLLGYFQLWNPANSVGPKRFFEMPTAAKYDVLFGLSFPEERRALLPDFEVLHLGQSWTNWAGRKTSRWC